MVKIKLPLVLNLVAYGSLVYSTFEAARMYLVSPALLVTTPLFSIPMGLFCCAFVSVFADHNPLPASIAALLGLLAALAI